MARLILFRHNGKRFYQGEWEDDKPSGKGTLYWPNDSKRSEGSFKAGKRNGHCVARREQDGAAVFDGIYEDDQRVEGKAMTPDGWKQFDKNNKNLPKTPGLPRSNSGPEVIAAKKNNESKDACCTIF